MRHSSTASTGFTLVEVLVISPIIILFIGAFIALLVSLTGETLTIREKNTTAYDTQAALDDIENSVVQATGFMTTSGTVPVPQGKDDSTSTGTPFTSTTSGQPDTLIVKSPATDQGPSNSARTLIYTGTGSCDSKNPIYTYMTVFFVADDPDTADTTDKALYKRTILPQISACKSPWQRGSCAASVASSNPSVCKTTDDKLLSNVATFTVQYLTGTSTTTADAANSVSVNVTTTKQIAGNTVTYSGKTRATSVNASTTDTSQSTPPSNPPITFTRDSSLPNPYRTTFSWASVGNATSYSVRYKIGSGSWIQQTVAQSSNPSFNVDAAARKQAINFEVNVVTNAGTYSYGTAPVVPDIPRWNECTPTNGWQNYDGTFNTLGFTKTTTGAVGLKGLIRSGPIGFNTGYAACYLPAGFRPANHLIYNGVAYDPNGSGGNGSARIDIFPDGAVVVVGGSNTTYTNGFVSLDGIIFMSPSGNPSWQAGTWQSGWYYNSYSDTYPNLGYWKDSLGRVWVQGLGTGGQASAVMAYLPSNMYPSAGMHYPVSVDARGGAVNIGGSINSRPSSGGYISTQLLYYAQTGGMATLPLYNGWVSYDNGVSWTHPQCYKGADDIVILQGLVRAGNQAAGGMTHVGVCGSNPYMSTGRRALFTAWKNWETQGRMDLPTDGYLYPLASDPGWTSLDAIHYIAD